MVLQPVAKNVAPFTRKFNYDPSFLVKFYSADLSVIDRRCARYMWTYWTCRQGRFAASADTSANAEFFSRSLREIFAAVGFSHWDLGGGVYEQ